MRKLRSLSLVAVALVAAVAASAPITSEQFAPGWQSHAKPLYNMGFSTLSNRDKWYVPGTLARGDYVLVRRTGDKAEVIEGYRFTVTGGIADQYVFLTPGLGDVEAIPAADVPSLRQREGSASVR